MDRPRREAATRQRAQRANSDEAAGDVEELRGAGSRGGAAKKDKWRGKKHVEKGVKTCINCGSTETPLWRRNYCNACALYKKHHQGEDRPLDMQMRPKAMSTTKKAPRTDREPKESAAKHHAEPKEVKPTRINPPREKRRVGSIVDPSTPVDDEEEEELWQQPKRPRPDPKLAPAPLTKQLSGKRERPAVGAKATTPRGSNSSANAASGEALDAAAKPTCRGTGAGKRGAKGREATLEGHEADVASDGESDLSDSEFPIQQVRASYESGPKLETDEMPTAPVVAEPFAEQTYGMENMPIRVEHAVSSEMFMSLWGEGEQYSCPVISDDSSSPSSYAESSESTGGSASASISSGALSSSSRETKIISMPGKGSILPDMSECGTIDGAEISVSVDDWLNTLSGEGC